jgi:hypothetical protein
MLLTTGGSHRRWTAHGKQPWAGSETALVLDSAATSKGGKRRGQDQCGQATKGVWGMSWRQEAMKGVEDCDKPGGLVKRELIPGCPNDCTMNP